MLHRLVDPPHFHSLGKLKTAIKRASERLVLSPLSELPRCWGLPLKTFTRSGQLITAKKNKDTRRTQSSPGVHGKQNKMLHRLVDPPHFHSLGKLKTAIKRASERLVLGPVSELRSCLRRCGGLPIKTFANKGFAKLKDDCRVFNSKKRVTAEKSKEILTPEKEKSRC